MVKMPKTYITKKSIDEYYKTAMEKINLKMKAKKKAKKTAEAAEKFIAKAKMAAEKAKEKAMKAAAKPKAVKGSKGKAVKKPRAKKVVGGTPRIDDLVKSYMNENERLINKAIQDYDNNKNKGDFVNNLSSINLDGEETDVAANIMRLLMSRELTDDNISLLYESMEDLKESYKLLK
jgi:membrane protein involved in colicin uptake